MRLLITRRISPRVHSRLAEHFQLDDNQAHDTPLTPQQLRERIASADYLFCTVADKIDSSVIEAAPNLKMIATGAVGTNNIDLVSCRARGISVSNTPEVLNETTADFGFALLMSIARRVPESERALRRGEWTGWAFDQFSGVDVHRARLGILGMGRIGSAIARRATGFDMELAYHNRSQSPQAESLGARYMTLDELLGWADFLMIVVPYSPETHHLVDAEALRKMRPDAVLINIARGGVVDDQALVEALQQGRLRGAALDVFEGEPALHPGFLDLENVVLTPHIASSSEATRLAMMSLAAENLLAHLSGQPLITPV